MKELLTTNNTNKPKGRSGSVKKRGSVHVKKKEFCKLTSFKLYMLVFIIFAVFFFILTYLIFKKLKQVSELEKVIKVRDKELQDGDNTRIELINQIDAVEKQIELKKKIY